MLNAFTRMNVWLAVRKLAIWIQGVDPRSCPTFTAGSGAPTAHEPKGSLYLRTGGSGASSVAYVATDSVGTWVALANTAIAVQVQTAGGETYVIDVTASASGEALVKVKDDSATAFQILEGANNILKVTSTNGAELATWGYKQAAGATTNLIADPGNAGAIPVTATGVCALTTAGSETRTLAAPSFIGQRIALVIDVDGGSAVVTVASAINQTGNTIITMAEVKDFIELLAVQIAGVKAWRVVANDGCALS